jgi:hypothetical protein
VSWSRGREHNWAGNISNCRSRNSRGVKFSGVNRHIQIHLFLNDSQNNDDGLRLFLRWIISMNTTTSTEKSDDVELPRNASAGGRHSTLDNT